MKNILIIGCGLIGSSLLRSIADKKIAKKIFIYEKSKSNVLKIKKLKLPCEVTNDLKKIIPNIDLIIFCTPLGEYEKIILKINKYLLPKTIITDVGSSKEKSMDLIKRRLKKGIFWTSSHPIERCFLLVFFSFINMHHLLRNKFFSPCSGPLTSDPAIG